MNILEEMKERENKEYRDYQWNIYNYHINNRIVAFNEYLIELLKDSVIDKDDIIKLYNDKDHLTKVAHNFGYTNEYEITEIYERMFILISFMEIPNE